jgi:hypothetical protein
MQPVQGFHAPVVFDIGGQVGGAGQGIGQVVTPSAATADGDPPAVSVT